MKTRFGVITLLIVFGLLASSCIHAEMASVPKFTPPEGKVLVFVGQDKQTLARYHKEVGITPAGVMVYTSINKMEGIYQPKDNGAGDQHAQWLIEKFPESAIQIGLYMVGQLDMVPTGVYDDNIEKLAGFFNENDRPFYLRIGYEFDAPSNNYLPPKYIEAYRYIHNKLTDLGVNNVAYVWHAHGGLYERPHMDWYPGDAYVDWVGLSYFSPYNKDGMLKVVQVAQSLNKPLMIAESTPIQLFTKDGEDTWKRWYRFVFKHINEYNIKAFCYINSFWDDMPMFAKDRWGDARIEQSEFIKKKWLEEMADKKYMHASDELFQKLNYQREAAIPQ